MATPSVDTQVGDLLRKIILQERDEAPSTTSDSSVTSESASSAADRDGKKGATTPSIPASFEDLPLSNDPDLIFDRRLPSMRDQDGDAVNRREDEDEEGSSQWRTPVQMPDPDVNEDIVLSQVTLCKTFTFLSSIVWYMQQSDVEAGDILNWMQDREDTYSDDEEEEGGKEREDIMYVSKQQAVL